MIKYLILTLAIIVVNTTKIYSQVTIGADIKPIEGVLLDLKENDNIGENATKGLLLPRVALSDLFSLDDIAVGLEKEQHIGLMVYNVTDTLTLNCFEMPKGVYVWIGARWKSLDYDPINRNTTKEDLKCLQKILDDNPDNTLGWVIDTVNIDNPNNYTLKGVVWEDGCSKRVATLNCSNSNLDQLDVLGLSALTLLNCNANNLRTLDVSGLSALRTLNCLNNSIRTLNVSGATALRSLNCGTNKIVDLDVSKLSALRTLNCISNNLTSLDVSGLSALKLLLCGNNNLNSLNVLGATALTNILCENNKLTSLDLSGLTALSSIDCKDNPLMNIANSIIICTSNFNGLSNTSMPSKTSGCYNKIECP